MKVPHNGQGKHQHLAQAPKSSVDNTTGCLVVAGVAFLIFLLSQCASKTQTTGNESGPGSAPQAIATAIATQTLPPVEALDGVSVRKGVSDLKKAAGEGLAGEMIYSQNCYDALSRQFTWPKLDACGAFDAGASIALGEDPTGPEKEIAWFQSEAVAGRYLNAASSAGEAPEEADSRLDELQARVAKAHPSGIQGTAAPSEVASDAASVSTSDAATQPEPMDGE